jgi:hypothetical protein
MGRRPGPLPPQVPYRARQHKPPQAPPPVPPQGTPQPPGMTRPGADSTRALYPARPRPVPQRSLSVPRPPLPPQRPVPPGPYASRSPYASREPYGPPDDMLVSGRETTGPGDLWYRLPARTRRTAAAALCLALLGAGGYTVLNRPEATGSWWQSDRQPQPPPDSAPPSATARRLPYPAQTARITFDRLAVSDRARRTFTVELRAASTAPLTVLKVDQGYEAVDLDLAGRSPVAVSPEAPRTLVLKAKVTNCDRAPLRARSPFLNVTLRNDRARQELSVIPGERYAEALTHAFRTLCGPEGSAAEPAP